MKIRNLKTRSDPDRSDRDDAMRQGPLPFRFDDEDDDDEDG